MICFEIGFWSGVRFMCNLVDCGFVIFIEDGVRVGDVYIYGNSVIYICDEGFEFIGVSDFICWVDRIWFNFFFLC